jgi:hypothetical protein
MARLRQIGRTTERQPVDFAKTQACGKYDATV